MERRRLHRRDNRVWSEEERNAYRASLLLPGPLLMGWYERDVWGEAR